MDKLFKIKAGSAAINVGASILVHIILFLALSFLLKNVSGLNMPGPMYIQVSTGNYSKPEQSVVPEEEIPEEDVPRETVPEIPVKKEVSYFYSDKDADTTGLRNVYSEKTLNVNIKYPAGWVFVDQNVKNKLDGVTFWGMANVYNPPPYIHLEVKEKYLFNRSRYKYSEEYEDYTIFYNDPSEMADQYTQIIYIRTEDDEDFSLKLIMKGKENFRTFQPVFFGMLKTFKFGSRSVF